MSNLLVLAEVRLASKVSSYFKIECDALEDSDWACAAEMLARRVKPFSTVEGVPNGGLKFAAALESYCVPGHGLLIVDDVVTTGGSMEKYRDHRPAIGGTLFSRGFHPGWVVPLFTLSPEKLALGPRAKWRST